MNKRILLLSSIALMGSMSVAACGNESAQSSSSQSSVSTYSPVGELQQAFAKLKSNNFTVTYNEVFLSYGERTEVKKYTPYALEASGDLGFSALAQSDEAVFKYTISDNQIVSGLPLINNEGFRVQSIFDYTYGMESFDVSALPTAPRDDGSYVYTYGNNVYNDAIFASIFLSRSIASGIYPDETIIKIEDGDIKIDSVILDYGWDNLKDMAYVTVSDVGTTENALIKEYLGSGKSSKKPLDNRFYKFITPYMDSDNYTIHCDASKLASIDFDVVQKMSPNSIATIDKKGNETGYLLKGGLVCSYKVVDGKVQITGNPVEDENNTFYSYLYGGILEYTISMLSFDGFVGYVDEEHENSYIITDSQTVGVLGYVCYCSITDETYTDSVRLEITDEEKGNFKLYFKLRNKNTKNDLGVYTCEFYGLNDTKNEAVDRYLSLGEDAKDQSKSTLSSVLNRFRGNNYSLELPSSSVGLVKYSYTEDYFYESSYYDTSINYGFIKQEDGLFALSISEGEAVVDKSKDYSGGTNPVKLPGIGDYYGAENDLFYLSMFEDLENGFANDDLYNMDYYDVTEFGNYSYWENIKPGFAQAILDYVTGGTTAVYPLGAGFIVNEGEDDYDTRVSLICTFIAADGSYTNCFYFTFFDIGSTSVPEIEAIK